MTAAAEKIHVHIDRLYAAVVRLVDDRKRLVDGRMLAEVSLLQQLRDAVPAAAVGDRYVRGSSHSMPPVWSDAFDLCRDIDDAVKGWLPEGSSTSARLQALAAKKWRPQDAETVGTMAARVESWTAAISALLAPEKPKTISAPCPACSATHVYRKDSAGETVRVPALQITTQGCVCQACRHVWTPDLFVHLARVLGYEVPEGVLE